MRQAGSRQGRRHTGGGGRCCSPIQSLPSPRAPAGGRQPRRAPNSPLGACSSGKQRGQRSACGKGGRHGASGAGGWPRGYIANGIDPRDRRQGLRSPAPACPLPRISSKQAVHPPPAELLTHHVGCSTDQGKRPVGAQERHWSQCQSGDESAGQGAHEAARIARPPPFTHTRIFVSGLWSLYGESAEGQHQAGVPPANYFECMKPLAAAAAALSIR